MIVRCPKCRATTDDIYGFCIRCGYEFPKNENNENKCPLCQYMNPDEADYCVKCGTPLVFKKEYSENTSLSPIIIRKEIKKDADSFHMENSTSMWIIVFGYIFSILGGFLGLIIAIYLSTRKDPIARKHGHIQLVIFLTYLVIVAILMATGNIPHDILNQYQQMFAGNLTPLQR